MNAFPAENLFAGASSLENIVAEMIPENTVNILYNRTLQNRNPEIQNVHAYIMLAWHNALNISQISTMCSNSWCYVHVQE